MAGAADGDVVWQGLERRLGAERARGALRVHGRPADGQQAGPGRRLGLGLGDGRGEERQQRGRHPISRRSAAGPPIGTNPARS